MDACSAVSCILYKKKERPSMTSSKKHGTTNAVEKERGKMRFNTYDYDATDLTGLYFTKLHAKQPQCGRAVAGVSVCQT